MPTTKPAQRTELKNPVKLTVEKFVGQYFVLEGTPGISKFNYLLQRKSRQKQNSSQIFDQQQRTDDCHLRLFV